MNNKQIADILDGLSGRDGKVPVIFNPSAPRHIGYAASTKQAYDLLHGENLRAAWVMEADYRGLKFLIAQI